MSRRTFASSGRTPVFSTQHFAIAVVGNLHAPRKRSVSVALTAKRCEPSDLGRLALGSHDPSQSLHSGHVRQTSWTRTRVYPEAKVGVGRMRRYCLSRLLMSLSDFVYKPVAGRTSPDQLLCLGVEHVDSTVPACKGQLRTLSRTFATHDDYLER